MPDVGVCRSKGRRRELVAGGCARRRFDQVTAKFDNETSDAVLIELVRQGVVGAYGRLFELHLRAARNLARQLTRSDAEVDDFVAEAFVKVLGILLAGRGPASAFRAYLLTALRNTAYNKARRDRKVELADDVASLAGSVISVPFRDTAVEGEDRSLAARAFARLPERWQEALWHTEIEGLSPADAAPLMGLSPNGMSALAYRARGGLREAYLQVHLAATGVATQCGQTVDRLGSWTRGTLSKRETAQVDEHLDKCASCRARSVELAEISSRLG